jgi:uncharacterized membrane protein YkvI
MIIFVGPGFSTGREVVQYSAQFGALGVWSVVVAVIGIAILCAIGYELARVLGAYNYRALLRALIGRFWPLFDLLWATFSILVLGVVSAGVGEVLSGAFNIPYNVGVVGILLLAVGVSFFGRGWLERFDLLGAIVFVGGVSVFALFILVQRWNEVGEVFATGDASQSGSPTLTAALIAGLVYVGYGFPSSFIPVLFALDRQKTRAETALSGVLSAIFVIIPFTLTYLAVLSFYQKDVIEAPIPWLVMFERSGGAALAILFAIVFVYAVLTSAVAFIHAFVERINHDRVERGGSALAPPQRGALAGILVTVAFVLSQVGVITLIARGYTYFSYAFLLIFVLPLLTRGVYLIAVSRRDRVPHADPRISG